MRVQVGTTLRAQWLGRRMRDLREAIPMSVKEAAAYVKRDPSTLGRCENGIYPFRADDVRALLDLYGVHDDGRRSALLKLADDSWKTGWWQGYAAEVDDSLIDYVWLESRAATIRSFDMGSVFGLLQTPEYARAVMRGVEPDADDQQIERWSELRLMRQAILKRATPVKLSVVIEETLLHRMVGGPSVLAAQLRHIADCAEQPNIDVRVLPFSAGAHASLDGTFRVFGLEEPSSDIACIESPAGIIYLEAPEVDRFAAAYDRLQQAALDPKKSAALLKSTAKQLE